MNATRTTLQIKMLPEGTLVCTKRCYSELSKTSLKKNISIKPEKVMKAGINLLKTHRNMVKVCKTWL